MKKVVIFLADGFEEIEALAPADLLRRAGAEVSLVATDGMTVTGARGVKVAADTDAVGSPDMIVLPGGFPGYENLAKSEKVNAAVDAALRDGRFVAAICGAPAAVLGRRGILKGKRAVCYPGMEDELGCTVAEGGVCADGNIITGKSAGYAIPFALTLIRELIGAEAADKVARGIVYNG